MNPIGSNSGISIPNSPAQGQVKTSAPAKPILPKPVSADQVIDTKAAEQRRFETVQRLSQDIANVFVIGDKRFTIFKDISGQYVTRFTSLQDGKVTYIPEPELFKIQSTAQNVAPAIKLNV